MINEELAHETPADLCLPGGWRVHHRGHAASREWIEVYDASRDLVGLVTTTDRRMVSVAGAWRQFVPGAMRGSRWWTLAIGHASDVGEARVTFGRKSRSGPVLRTFVTPRVRAGLWIALVSGPQLTVSIEQGMCRHRQFVIPRARTCAVHGAAIPLG
ncbi:hypothetical protein ACSMXN_01390 [Jatrophihabitans sp. DSM 45814]